MNSLLKRFSLIILCNTLYQKQAYMAILTCDNHYAKKVLNTSAMTMKELLSECAGAFDMYLQGATTFFASGLDKDRLSILLGIENAYMCIWIENATATGVITFLESIKGSCEGPKLTIINNPFLSVLYLKSELFGNVRSMSHAIRIRGNKMLPKKEIDKIKKAANGSDCLDIQAVGECALPKPFKSFQTLDRNCSLFYGPLVLEEGVKEIFYNISEIHEFALEGCVQIERTELDDLTFLNAFSRFKPIPFCIQFVRDNSKLCYSNLNYLNEIFESIEFYNNSKEECNECLGGKVSERYLDESTNCSSINGDLIIANFRGIPSNIWNLRGIESINGRLIITNNTGLNIFEYLQSLKEVGRTQNGQEVAIIVKDNADLKLLKMPYLLNKKQKKRIELDNNPMLIYGEVQTATELRTLKKTTSVFLSRSKANAWKQRSNNFSSSAAHQLSKALLHVIMAARLWSPPHNLQHPACF